MDDDIRVLVVGDIMLDVYSRVDFTRLAPEASIPVWDVIEREIRLGGAANVANNVKRLGGPRFKVELAGIIGLEWDGIHLIKGCGIGTDMCVGGSTMTKHRFVTEINGKTKFVFRTDNFRKFPEKDVSFFDMISRSLLDGQFHAVIISDYDKGTVTDSVASMLSRHHLSIIDSKRSDLRPFRGSKILKINDDEYSVQVSNQLYPYFEDLAEYCVVTKGDRGAQIRQLERSKSNHSRYMVHTEMFPVESVDVVDVTGCGDTHTAAMAVSLLINGGDVRTAVRYANQCARDVVGKFGTSVCD